MARSDGNLEGLDGDFDTEVSEGVNDGAFPGENGDFFPAKFQGRFSGRGVPHADGADKGPFWGRRAVGHSDPMAAWDFVGELVNGQR